MTTSVSLSSGTSPGELCVLIYPDRTSLPVSVLGLLLLNDPCLTWRDRSHIRGKVRELPVLVNGGFEVGEEPALNNLPVLRYLRVALSSEFYRSGPDCRRTSRPHHSPHLSSVRPPDTSPACPGPARPDWGRCPPPESSSSPQTLPAVWSFSLLLRLPGEILRSPGWEASSSRD